MSRGKLSDRLARINAAVSRATEGEPTAAQVPSAALNVHLPLGGGAAPITRHVEKAGESAWAKASRLEREMEEAKASGRLILEIDADRLIDTKYRDRDDRGFADSAFEELRASIAEHGQLSPVSARPSKEQPGFYEIVYGHRRVHACRALGIPVRAIVQDVDDLGLIVRMEIENAKRKDLSAFEQGRKFRVWIQAGLVKQVDIARHFQMSEATVSKYLSLTGVPNEILHALGDERKVPLRHAYRLAVALKREGNLERALALAPVVGRESIGVVSKVEWLCTGKKPGRTKADEINVHKDRQGQVLARMVSDANGGTAFRFDSSVDKVLLARLWSELIEKLQNESHRARPAEAVE